jgi:ATP-binding cassette subfamily B (MDR/TAP) protein 1
MFKIVDRPSKIDPLAEGGNKPEGPQESKVELRNVTFAYPSRPTLPILKDFSITFEAGKTTALVGSSGSGKSTIVSLIERWFDTDSGSVLVGGHAVTDLNVRWLRSQIGVVQQEPVLFSDSIYNNVAHGLYGTKMDLLPEVEKRELVRQACIQAFADDFIQDLPDKYDTLVGERGQLLSGGQKQRIAIARVVISDPRILLLDEATSALDPTAEKNVQAALDNVSKSRTTIMVAHKLSTVQRADNIVVLSHGKVIEQGTHQQLLADKGSYHKLVHSQTLDTKEEAMSGFKDQHGDERAIGNGAETDNGLPEMRPSRSLSRSGKDTVAMSDVNDKPSADEEEQESEDNDITKRLSLARCIAIIIFQEQRHLWFLFLAGVISSAGSGGAFPAQAVLFGKSIPTLQLPRGQHLVNTGNFWALMYFVFGLGVLVVYWGVGFWWTVASFRATRQYRREYFESMMHQDVAFFDLKGHSAAEMTSRLSLHPLHLQMLLSTNLALILLVLFNVMGCCILSLVVGWELALPVIALGVPLLFGAGYFRMRMEMSNQDRVTAIYQEAARFASEAVGAIRTVSSLALEHKVIDGYEKRLSQSAKLEIRHKLLSMLLFAFSESISLAVSAFSFWYGGKLLSEGKYDVTTFFIVFVAISMGMQTAGFMFGFTSGKLHFHLTV